MCQDMTYLNQGTCSLCDYSCASCLASSRICTKCITGFYKNRDNACSQDCFGVAINHYTNGPICIPCHPSCIGCTIYPQNCYTCSSNSTYIDGSLGLNVCSACKSPCAKCLSVDNCLSCVDGHYLAGSNCIKCDLSCLTCNGPSNSSCLSCFGSSKLTSNGFCRGCSISCNVCNATTCASCSTGFLLYQGNCVSTCPSQTYNSGNNCMNCDQSCAVCNSTNCTKCANNYNYILDNVCYVSCPINYSPNSNYCIKNVGPPSKNNDTNNTNNDPKKNTTDPKKNTTDY
jgi:hypothetical protein